MALRRRFGTPGRAKTLLNARVVVLRRAVIFLRTGGIAQPGGWTTDGIAADDRIAHLHIRRFSQAALGSRSDRCPHDPVGVLTDHGALVGAWISHSIRTNWVFSQGQRRAALLT